MSEASLSIDRQRVGAFKKRACRKNVFKHSHTVECGNRLRVGVRVTGPIPKITGWKFIILGSF